jgi:hypothetical protein
MCNVKDGGQINDILFYYILLFYSIYPGYIWKILGFFQFIVGFTFCIFDQGVENRTATVERIIILGFVYVNIMHF